MLPKELNQLGFSEESTPSWAKEFKTPSLCINSCSSRAWSMLIAAKRTYTADRLRESLRWEGWIWSPAHHLATIEVEKSAFYRALGRNYRLLQLTKSQNAKTSCWGGHSRGWEQRSEVEHVSLWMLGASRRRGEHSRWEGLSSELRWLMAATHRSGRRSLQLLTEPPQQTPSCLYLIPQACFWWWEAALADSSLTRPVLFCSAVLYVGDEILFLHGTTRPQKVGASATLHTTLKQCGTQKVDKSSSILSSGGKFWNTLCRCPHGIKSLAHSSDLYNLLSLLGFPFSLFYPLASHSCFLGSLPK